MDKKLTVNRLPQELDTIDDETLENIYTLVINQMHTRGYDLLDDTENKRAAGVSTSK